MPPDGRGDVICIGAVGQGRYAAVRSCRMYVAPSP